MTILVDKEFLMEINYVDARGQTCPTPLILTRKAFLDMKQGEQILITVDNLTAKENVERFLKEQGCNPIEVSMENGIYTLASEKVLPFSPQTQLHKNNTLHNDKTSHLICFKSKTMGTGADELGEILIKGFISTIKEITPLPTALLFYNSGVFLTLTSSPVLVALKDLEHKGVKILVCGTCLDYFNKKQEIGVGTISNLYDILQTLSQNSHIIYP